MRSYKLHGVVDEPDRAKRRPPFPASAVTPASQHSKSTWHLCTKHVLTIHVTHRFQIVGPRLANQNQLQALGELKHEHAVAPLLCNCQGGVCIPNITIYILCKSTRPTCIPNGQVRVSRTLRIRHIIPSILLSPDLPPWPHNLVRNAERKLDLRRAASMRARRPRRDVPPIAGITRRDIAALGLVGTIAGINRRRFCFGNPDQDGSFAELKTVHSIHARHAHRYGARCLLGGAQVEILRKDQWQDGGRIAAQFPPLSSAFHLGQRVKRERTDKKPGHG